MSRARQREMANGSRDVKNRTQKREKSNTLAELKRKGTYLVRQFSNPQGPLLNREGKSTPLALSARSVGEPVPKNSASVRRLAHHCRRAGECPDERFPAVRGGR